eukprot:4844651-Amphidinium_carterae.1
MQLASTGMRPTKAEPLQNLLMPSYPQCKVSVGSRPPRKCNISPIDQAIQRELIGDGLALAEAVPGLDC